MTLNLKKYLIDFFAQKKERREEGFHPTFASMGQGFESCCFQKTMMKKLMKVQMAVAVVGERKNWIAFHPDLRL